MHTNYTNGNQKLIYPELSYVITGICFEIQNKMGRFSREKQYCDLMEKYFKDYKISYKREYAIKGTGNIIDFLIDDKIILEVKAKKFVLKEDYYQIQRYLQIADKKLGLIINFRSRYLKPIRIIKIETDARSRFLD